MFVKTINIFLPFTIQTHRLHLNNYNGLEKCNVFQQICCCRRTCTVTITPAVTTPCAGEVVQAPVLSCYVNCSFVEVNF